MCQMPNIWHIWYTKHKNETLSDVPNLKNYATLLQYRLKYYETIWTTMAKWDIIIFCVFLSPLPQISLSPSTLSYFFSLCHSLSLPSPFCSRKLLKITLKKVAADLAASLSSSHQSSLLISPPHSPQLATSCSSFG